MLDWIVLRTIGRKVGYPDFQIEGAGECLQILLKERRARGVATATLTQDESFLSFLVVMTPVQIPPMSHAVAGKFSRIMACSQIDVSLVPTYVVQTMGPPLPVAVAGEIVIQHFDGFPDVKLAVAVKIAEHFFLLGIHGEHGLACRKILGFERSDIFELWITFRRLLE